MRHVQFDRKAYQEDGIGHIEKEEYQNLLDWLIILGLFYSVIFQLLNERGEKLAGLGDKTEDMSIQAQAFSDAAHQLMLKYKDKKWYQF